MSKLYLAVTNDKFELPVGVGRSAQELADLIGWNKYSVFKAIYTTKICERPKAKYNFYKVEVEDGESDV